MSTEQNNTHKEILEITLLKEFSPAKRTFDNYRILPHTDMVDNKKGGGWQNVPVDNGGLTLLIYLQNFLMYVATHPLFMCRGGWTRSLAHKKLARCHIYKEVLQIITATCPLFMCTRLCPTSKSKSRSKALEIFLNGKTYWNPREKMIRCHTLPVHPSCFL